VNDLDADKLLLNGEQKRNKEKYIPSVSKFCFSSNLITPPELELISFVIFKSFE
jgi:hypothetical protein